MPRASASPIRLVMVCDFPVPGGPWMTRVAPVHGVQNREGLRAVRVHHRVKTGLAQVVAEVPVFAEFGRFVREAIAAEELLHQRVVGRLASFRPGLGVQVLVDEQLAEGEEVQVDLVALDRPAGLLCDRLLDPGQVVFHIEVVLGRHFRQVDIEIQLQLRFERKIRLDLVLCPRELEALSHAGPGELNGDQDQWGATLGGAGVGLVPLEHPEGEVEDVDALLLDREAGLPEGLAEAEVEAGEGERGLELVVGVAGGGSGWVFRRFGKEGQEFGGDVGRGFVCTVCVLGNGLLASSPRASVPFPFRRGEEVHDPFGADEDLE